MSVLVETLRKEIVNDEGKEKHDISKDSSAYPDYSDYIDYSDSGSWSDNWNDGPTHSDTWSDTGWYFKESADKI